jgi:hypothetical protein
MLAQTASGSTPYFSLIQSGLPEIALWLLCSILNDLY